MKLTIQELLFNRGLPKPDKIKIKVVRHKQAGRDLYNDYKFNRQAFLIYQAEQGREVFNCDYIVSFLGEEGSKARFIGVFKINGHLVSPDGGFHYNISEVEGFEDIKERVIVDWGKSTISWVQWISNEKEVIEIQPTFLYRSFKDYLDFILDFEQLKQMVLQKNHFKDWFVMLSAVKGVYLILDKSTNMQYVGSAYGEGGIWGRWSEYAATSGHGNNVLLKNLIDKDSNYARNFQFTILMTLPKTMTDSEVIMREQLYKQKLGSVLNLN